MTFKALFYAYVLGGLTFIPLLLAALVCYTIYTSVPVDSSATRKSVSEKSDELSDVNDLPKPRKGWLTVRRTFEESTFDGSYVTLVRSFLDARSKDPKRSRPKDMWYVVLKGTVLYLYEDESMTECEAAIEMGRHHVTIYPDSLLDGELFTKRNAIRLSTKPILDDKSMPSVTKEMQLDAIDVQAKVEESDAGPRQKERERDRLLEQERQKEMARSEALDHSTPWFIFVRSTVEMEDWYFALVHASEWPSQTPTLFPLQQVFLPSDMDHLVSTLDEQPDVIPMRWLNALFGRIFYSFYRTQLLESFIIGRLMKKLSKVKRPAFLADVVVTEVSVGNTTPTFSKPMLKELTKEGDASLEVHMQYKGEVRITVEATATINLGARFKSYTVKLVLAAVLKELEGNLLVKVKRPPSNRIWYAFTQTPRMVLEVEPIVSDRQITWGMILTTIESRLKEIIQESVVMPNMDDIAFFESSRHEHRGGIWSDAARRHHHQSISPQPQDGSLPIVVEPSAPDVSEGSETFVKEQPEPAPSVNSLRADDRPRTWSSSTRSNFDSLMTDQNDSSPRGRSTEVEKMSSPRAHSQPDLAPAVMSEEEPDEKVPQTISHNRRHSSSARRQPSRESFESDRATSLTEPSTPTKPTDPSHSVSSSPSSFLSTLKSRASDKQALSNTAKEAMRKWGVNWGGLRKDSTHVEDTPDNGPVGSRLSKADTAKARATYAEVRAAVAERKRDKAEDQTDGSLPIAIPKSSKGKERAVSSDSASDSGTSSLGKRHSGGDIVNTDEDDAEGKANGTTFSPIHVQPQGKTMMIPGIHASHRGEVQSMGYVAPQSPPQVAKNPVYRLWKGPSLSQSQESQDLDTLPSPPRPAPPPLPPRRTPTSVSRSSLEPSEISLDSSASEALKSIATKDEISRSVLEGES